VQDVNARRVLRWFDMFGCEKPVVVVQVPERLANEPYASVPAAVRHLVEVYDVKVIVDGSPNSVPPELLRTKRERVVNVEPMSREQLEAIPEFREFVEFLKNHKLDDAVWKVVGGCPAKFLQIELAFSSASGKSSEKVEAVKSAISKVLLISKRTIMECSANTEDIVKLWMEKKWEKVSVAELLKCGFELDIPNKVFRETAEGTVEFIVPANPATGLILSSGLAFQEHAVSEVENDLFKSTSKEV
jgi:hypothetical protein